jgi:hypothetical protein
MDTPPGGMAIEKRQMDVREEEEDEGGWRRDGNGKNVGKSVAAVDAFGQQANGWMDGGHGMLFSFPGGGGFYCLTSRFIKFLVKIDAANA